MQKDPDAYGTARAGRVAPTAGGESDSVVFFEDAMDRRVVGVEPTEEYQRDSADVKRPTDVTTYALASHVGRITARDVPIPFEPVLEDQTVPTIEPVADAARRAVRGEET